MFIRFVLARYDSAQAEQAGGAEEARGVGEGGPACWCNQIIQSSSDMGIWTKDLRTKAGLQQPQVAKILKFLEQRKLIKSIKWVTNRNRKVYMAFDVQPSKEITGGAWYTNNELDEEMIGVASRVCLKSVREKGGRVSFREVAAEVKKSELFHTALDEDEVRSILKLLVYDGKLEQCDEGCSDRGVYFKLSKVKPPASLPEHLVPFLQMGWYFRSGEKRRFVERGDMGSEAAAKAESGPKNQRLGMDQGGGGSRESEETVADGEYLFFKGT
mmetsp:Transcript_23636/g.50508  ORF Transcript_23636/g.50508 Transcript_23636/m.50508 type:complete len:271 (+) Transcript_23636:333-1145(+)